MKSTVLMTAILMAAPAAHAADPMAAADKEIKTAVEQAKPKKPTQMFCLASYGLSPEYSKGHCVSMNIMGPAGPDSEGLEWDAQALNSFTLDLERMPQYGYVVPMIGDEDCEVRPVVDLRVSSWYRDGEMVYLDFRLGHVSDADLGTDPRTRSADLFYRMPYLSETRLKIDYAHPMFLELRLNSDQQGLNFLELECELTSGAVK